MASLNRIEIIGNLGSEPEMRFSPSGKPYTTFSVATNNKYTTQNGERKEETEWFTVITYGKTAEMCNQFLQKGSQIYAEGRFKLHFWDGQDGQKRYQSQIRATKVVFLSKTNSPRPVENGDGGDIDVDEIPF